MSRENINCTILGSFKFKKDIDLVREEFEDHGVKVLAPEKGQVYSPPLVRHIQIANSFRPLPSERHHPIKMVEDTFLRAITMSDFTYLVDIDGYIGNVVSMEMGFVIARDIPLYASNAVDTRLDPDPDWQFQVRKIPVMAPIGALQDFKIKHCQENESETLVSLHLFP